MSKLVDILAKIDFDMMDNQEYVVQEVAKPYKNFDTKEHEGYKLSIQVFDPNSPLHMQIIPVKYKVAQMEEISIGAPVSVKFDREQTKLYAASRNNFASIELTATITGIKPKDNKAER